MKRMIGYLAVPAVFVPAFVAFFSAQYLIETFFPEVTLIDLGAFYALGFFSGISLGFTLMVYRREKPSGQ